MSNIYSRQKSIDKAYDYIQDKINKGYKYLGYPIYNVTKSDLQKVSDVADKYGLPFEWLMKLMKHESAGTFNPAITNSIGATGLIQFMTNISGKRMTYAKADGSGAVGTDKLRKMTFKEQMDYVDGFLTRGLKKVLVNGKVPDNFTQGQLFMTIFYPVSVSNPNYVFPDSVSRANAGIRTPKDYAKKALNKPVFSLDYFPNSIQEAKEKFKEFVTEVTEAVEETKEFTKRNWIPIAIILIGLGGLGYYLIKSKTLKLK